MKISELMTTDVETIPAEATVQEAALTMKTLNLGMLMVTDGGN